MVVPQAPWALLLVLATLLALPLSGCTAAPPTDGSGAVLAVSEDDAEATADALRARLEMAGWPWFTVENSGGAIKVRVGPLDATSRPLFERLVGAPLRLEGFVVGPEDADAATPPLFTSDDVTEAHLEKVRGASRVHFTLDRPAARRLEEATRQKTGGFLRAEFDGVALVHAPLHEPLRGGLVRISLPDAATGPGEVASQELVIALRAPMPPSARLVRFEPWSETK